MREPEVKSRECFSLRNTRQTLATVASDADVSVRCFHYRGACGRSGHRRVQQCHTGRGVITVVRPVLVMWPVAEELENTERCGTSDGDASDTSDVHFRARGAYWTASDTVCGAFGEEHQSVHCELN
jgi:hypothetical protein